MGFALFQGMFSLVFLAVVVLFLVTAVRGIGQWNRNNRSPVLTVEATVVTKRASVSRHHSAGGVNEVHMHTATTYYATFQVASGDRMELRVPSGEYGMLAEGDQGKLTFQGTRYQGFVRS